MGVRENISAGRVHDDAGPLSVRAADPDDGLADRKGNLRRRGDDGECEGGEKGDREGAGAGHAWDGITSGAAVRRGMLDTVDMKIHRFIGEFRLDASRIRIADHALAHQMKDVLKLRVGERVVLCDGRGTEADGTIAAFSKTGVDIDIMERRANANEPGRRVILYCAVIKRELFDFVVQKATEAGVAEIVPVTTRRTVKQGLKRERLVTIMREAAEQSGRGVLPVLHDVMALEEAIADAGRNETNVVADAGGSDIRSVKPVDRIGVFIGPEGGWESEEVRMMKEHGFPVVSFGKTTLRAETAALIGVYVFSWLI